MLEEIRSKLKGIYEIISENFYICRADERFNGNPTLLLGMLTCVLNGRELIYGNIGKGKTTSAEAIVSLMYGFPLSMILSCEAHGDPEITKEEYVAMPDLSDMKKVIWKRFAQFPPKIFDEFNRVPGPKQNLFLDSIDRGNFEYMNETLFSEPGPFFAICNWPDKGNVDLLPPMKDRFDVAVISSEPGILDRRAIAHRKLNNHLLDSTISKDMLEILDARNKTYEERIKELYDRAGSFKDELEKKLKIELIGSGEIQEARKDIEKIKLSKEAELFMDFVHAEFLCPNCGEKIPEQNEICKEGCHYAKTEYAFNKVKKPLSIRFDLSWRKYGRGLAWYFGDEIVETRHLELVFPYVFWHRTEFTEKYKTQHRPEAKGPLEIFLSEELMNEIVKRFAEDKGSVANAYGCYLNGDKDGLEEIKKTRDHPIFAHYLDEI